VVQLKSSESIRLTMVGQNCNGGLFFCRGRSRWTLLKGTGPLFSFSSAIFVFPITLAGYSSANPFFPLVSFQIVTFFLSLLFRHSPPLKFPPPRSTLGLLPPFLLMLLFSVSFEVPILFSYFPPSGKVRCVYFGGGHSDISPFPLPTHKKVAFLP